MTEHRGSNAAAMREAFTAAAGGVWIERDVLDVAGPDAGEYLQGQLSQNVVTIAAGESRRTLLLQPQGKVDAWMRVTLVGPDHYWLDVDAGHGAHAQARLQRFKLRVDCELTLSTKSVLAVRGPDAASGPAALGLEPGTDAVVLDALWPGIAGFDIVGGGTDNTGRLTVGSASDLDELRIRLGIPAMGSELDDSTIPAAAGIVDAAVDFTKGCYVGQELVARIDSRGSNTPTHLRGLRLGPSLVEVGALVTVEGKEVGTLTSVAGSADEGWFALAYIKRAVEAPTAASVAGGDGTQVSAQLVELPFI